MEWQKQIEDAGVARQAGGARPTSRQRIRTSSTEALALTRLAGPLILASLVSMGISITDVAMMSWLGPVALAAGAAASDFYSIVYYFAAGIVAAVSPMIAQARGRGDAQAIRLAVRQGFWVAAVLCIPGVLTVWHGQIILTSVGVKAEIAVGAGPYAKMMALAFAPLLCAMVWHHFLAAHGLTRVIFYVTACTLPVNALGNYALMFGHFGAPALGLAGAGVSSLIAGMFMLCALSGFALVNKRFRAYRILHGFFSPAWAQFREIFRVGTPIGIANFGELGVFMVSTIMMGAIGTQALAAHAVALRVAGVVYAVPLGFSQAATVRVAYARGAGDFNTMMQAAWTALSIALLVGLGYVGLIWGWNMEIARLFLDEQVARAVTLDAALFLTLVALLQPSDCLGTVLSGVLRGFKDTRLPGLISVAGFWGIGFAGGFVMAFMLDMNGLGIWVGLALGSVVVALALFWRLLWIWRKTPLLVGD